MGGGVVPQDGVGAADWRGVAGCGAGAGCPQAGEGDDAALAGCCATQLGRGAGAAVAACCTSGMGSFEIISPC